MDTPGIGKDMKTIMKAIWMADAAIIMVQDNLIFDFEDRELDP